MAQKKTTNKKATAKKNIILSVLLFVMFFSFSGLVSAQVCTLGNSVSNSTECATGSNCIENPIIPGQGICQNANIPAFNTFAPPTSTETFSDFI